MDINTTRTNQDEDGQFRPKATRARDLKINESVTGRLVDGPVRRLFQWWPTSYTDTRSNQEVKSWRSVSLPTERNFTSPLDEVAKADKAIKAQLLELSKKDKNLARSIFDRQQLFRYVWIKRTPAGSIIELLDANWTIVEGIKNLRTTKSSTASGYLKYGLPYMYDISISVQINSKTGRKEYYVTPEDYSATKDHIPEVYMDEKDHPIPNRAQFYNAADLELINSCGIVLDQIDPPLNEKQILEYIQKFPIDLDRRQKDNPTIPMIFTQKVEYDTILAMLNRFKLNYLPLSVNNNLALPDNSQLNIHPNPSAEAQANLSQQRISAPGPVVTPTPTPVPIVAPTPAPTIPVAKPAFDFGNPKPVDPVLNFAPPPGLTPAANPTPVMAPNPPAPPNVGNAPAQQINKVDW